MRLEVIRFLLPVRTGGRDNAQSGRKIARDAGGEAFVTRYGNLAWANMSCGKCHAILRPGVEQTRVR